MKEQIEANISRIDNQIKELVSAKTCLVKALDILNGKKRKVGRPRINGEKRTRKLFTEKEKAFIKKNRDKMSVYEIAKELGRSGSSVYHHYYDEVGIGKKDEK
jgi:hypothetical protein